MAARALVVGDIILDRYTQGTVRRLSPEAPVPVLNLQRQEYGLGGAAGVARLARALGMHVSILGVIGDDIEGEVVTRLLESAGIAQEHVLCDRTRPTTLKERFVTATPNGSSQQLLRVDREMSDPVGVEFQREWQRRLNRCLLANDVVLVSDYGKGVCGPALIRALIQMACDNGVPVLVDPPRGRSVRLYRRASLIAPNRTEAEHLCKSRITSGIDAIHAAHLLQRKYGWQTVVIKLDRDGMAIVDGETSEMIVPALTDTPRDVAGAGDMVLAVLGWSAASRIPLSTGAWLAAIAASIEVERLGVHPVTWLDIVCRLQAPSFIGSRKLMELDTLVEEVARNRDKVDHVVLVDGRLDMLDCTQSEAIQRLAAPANMVIVAVSDNVECDARLGDVTCHSGDHATARAWLTALQPAVQYVLLLRPTTMSAAIDRLRPHTFVTSEHFCAIHGDGVLASLRAHDVTVRILRKDAQLGRPIVDVANATLLNQFASEVEKDGHDTSCSSPIVSCDAELICQPEPSACTDAARSCHELSAVTGGDVDDRTVQLACPAERPR